MVPNTSELFPEPDTPVKTVSRRFGSSMLMSLRLLARAPCTRMRSWRSATCSADGDEPVFLALLIRSGLGDADQVARGIAYGAVARAPRLGRRFLEHLGS